MPDPMSAVAGPVVRGSSRANSEFTRARAQARAIAERTGIDRRAAATMLEQAVMMQRANLELMERVRRRTSQSVRVPAGRDPDSSPGRDVAAG
jgi:hypothetical protein